MIVRKPKSEKSVWFTSQVEKENQFLCLATLSESTKCMVVLKFVLSVKFYRAILLYEILRKNVEKKQKN